MGSEAEKGSVLSGLVGRGGTRRAAWVMLVCAPALAHIFTTRDVARGLVVNSRSSNNNDNNGTENNDDSDVHLPKYVFCLGLAAGSVVGGVAADVLAPRRKCISAAMASVAAVSGLLASSAVSSLWKSSACWFLVASGAMGAHVASFVEAAESFHDENRVAATVFLFGNMWTVAKLFRFAVTALTSDGGDVTFWLSVWIAAALCYRLVYMEASKWDVEEPLDTKADSNDTTLSQLLVRRPSLTVRQVFLCVIWFTLGMVYYGIILSTRAVFSGSPWAGLLYNVVRDTVSILLATFVCRKTGLTRMVFAVVMVVNGVAFFFMAFLGNCGEECGAAVGVGIPVQIVRFSISSCWAIMWFMTAASFPYRIRCTCTGISSAASRLGMVAGTWLVEEGHFFEQTESKVVAGFLVLASGILALQLPEKSGKPMTKAAMAEVRQYMGWPFALKKVPVVTNRSINREETTRPRQKSQTKQHLLEGLEGISNLNLETT